MKPLGKGFKYLWYKNEKMEQNPLVKKPNFCYSSEFFGKSGVFRSFLKTFEGAERFLARGAVWGCFPKQRWRLADVSEKAAFLSLGRKNVDRSQMFSLVPPVLAFWGKTLAARKSFRNSSNFTRKKRPNLGHKHGLSPFFCKPSTLCFGFGIVLNFLQASKWGKGVSKDGNFLQWVGEKLDSLKGSKSFKSKKLAECDRREDNV